MASETRNATGTMQHRKHDTQSDRSLPTLHAPLSTHHSAFTLVELLVVIVIISMMVGLLMPAVLGARSRARIVQCTNNQHELATAITQYEVATQRLPGYANQIGGTAAARSISEGWIPVLFPFMGRMDLWEGTNGWRRGAGSTPSPAKPQIKQLACPDDPLAGSEDLLLTYAVNLGVYIDPSTVTQNRPGSLPLVPSTSQLSPGALGVFRDYFNTPTNPVISFSNVRSAARTVLLGEKILFGGAVRRWSDPVNWYEVGFSWPDYSPPLPAPVPQPASAANQTILDDTLVGQSIVSGGTQYWPPLASAHPNIVVVTFCDGHVDSVANDASCNVYLATP